MGECSETGAAGEFRCGVREDARVCMYVCVCARHIWKLCDANDGAKQICRYRHMLQMLNVGDANDGAPQICRYRHMLQMLVYEGLRRRRCCATARLISKLCDANDGAPQICRYRHMLQMLNVCDANDGAPQICRYRHMVQMLVCFGLRRRRCCATARLISKLCDANDGAPQICRYRHMLQMLNVCDANDGAPQICRYRHMVQMLVYEGLRRRRWCATARLISKLCDANDGATHTHAANAERLRRKRPCKTDIHIQTHAANASV